MKISFKNIGVINSADIEICPLTVITGINDTGKSTVGRMLFTIIKAFSRYEEDLEVGEQEKIRSIFEILSEIFFEVRDKANPNSPIFIRRKDGITGTVAYKHPVYSSVETENIGPLLEEISLIRQKAIKTNLHLLNVEKLISILEILNGKLKPEDNLKLKIDKIKQIYTREDQKTDLVERALNKALFSEFYSELSISEISAINISEGQKKLIHFEVDKHKIKNFDYNDDLYYNEATFLESPVILHLYDALKYANTLFELRDKNYSLYRDRGRVPFHIKDLMTKLEKISYFTDFSAGINSYQLKFSDYIEYNSENEEIIENTSENSLNKQKYNILTEISNTINGNMGYSKDTKDFIYEKSIKNKKYKIRSINTATGIKSFGLLQMLLQTDFLNERHLVIIDEPESGLHPEWQLKYSETIVKLAKTGIPFLLTTHSPYMVQALSHYSNKENLSDKVKFYMAEKENEFSNFIDVSNDLSRIFEKLSQPLEKVVYE